ncbi:uncharacterized protein LOC122319480 [Drosophila yakuba]|uniref:uncharacterized protein LOC122319480 n=1 Tax=Drosophila yakuba TaxID=7245 RepID=UPI001C8A3D8F|nr:uncharacterized protein LOC122319480 [Drosophila yakuba]
MEITATMNTGATASFISKEFADRLRTVGEVVSTRREVRMADGRYEEVTSLIEVDVGLGEGTVRMQLLILHNIIDALVVGWDFLTKVGARIECAGLSTAIPAGQVFRGREKVPVAIWKVMPFGLHSASATFQRALDQVIGPQIMPHAFAYQDDIIVIRRTLQEHKRNLKEVFRRLRAANLNINADKCKFFRKELQYLGHRVTDQGIETDPEKGAAIAQLKPQGNVKELRQYLGAASC